MSTPPNIKRIRVEDFDPEMQETIGKIAYSLNSFMDDVIYILNGNIDISNLAQNVINITVQTDGSSDINNAPIQIQSGIENRKIQGVLCIKQTCTVTATGASVSVDHLPAFEWTIDGTILRITAIKGLPANSTCQLKLLLIPENN